MKKNQNHSLVMTDTHNMTSLGQCSTEGLSKGESQPLNHQEIEAITGSSHKYFWSHNWKERCKVAMERAYELKEWLQGHSEDTCSESHPWKTCCMVRTRGNAHKLKYRKFCAFSPQPPCHWPEIILGWETTRSHMLMNEQRDTNNCQLTQDSQLSTEQNSSITECSNLPY